MYDLAIIGGGVSGLTAAAIAIKRGLSVVIFEYDARVGQKLLITGNGKANLSNTNMSAEYYNDSFVGKFLPSSQKVYDFFEYIGLKTKVIDGRIYPYSESAASVLNLLRKKMEKAEIVTNYEVSNISIDDGHFVINNNYQAKNCIFSTGSAATKGKNSHYLLEKFGHKCVELKASIVPLIADTTYIKGLSGIRVKAKLSLIDNNKVVKSAIGELLFKDNGISGIVSMELSSYIARNSGKYSISIDFAVDFSEKEIELAKRQIKKAKVSKNIDSADVASITDLSLYPSNSFDGVLCLGGPLSHLMTERDRKKAVKELIRVAKPGAFVFISVMNLMATIAGTIRGWPQEIDSPQLWERFWKK
ncbi:methyltransferase domain-containing protein, partial [bacterium]|nr:methyltransferase domain-containing protein [bacterium]